MHALQSRRAQIFWIALLGALCGVLGGMYNKVMER
jgi:hypothetical protein